MSDVENNHPTPVPTKKRKRSGKERERRKAELIAAAAASAAAQETLDDKPEVDDGEQEDIENVPAEAIDVDEDASPEDPDRVDIDTVKTRVVSRSLLLIP